MSKITGDKLAQAAMNALDMGISYQQEDCQAFVKNSFKRAGGDMGRYAGSNDMARNAMSKLYLLPTAMKENLMQPGWLLYMIEPGHNTKYDDEMGDATHVGIYTGIPGKEIVHSSKSKGGVIASTFHKGHLWTHGGPADAAIYTYESSEGNEYSGEGGAINMDTLHRVILPIENAGETVNMRKNAAPQSVVLHKIRDGTELMAGDEITKNGQQWKAVTYQGMTGYIMARYLDELSGSTDAPPYFPLYPPSIEPPTTNNERLDLLERRVANIEKTTGIKFGG